MDTFPSGKNVYYGLDTFSSDKNVFNHRRKVRRVKAENMKPLVLRVCSGSMALLQTALFVHETTLNCFGVWKKKERRRKVRNKNNFFFSSWRFKTQNVTQTLIVFVEIKKKLNKGAARQFLLCRFTELHSDASQMADEQDALKTVAHPQWGNTELQQTSFFIHHVTRPSLSLSQNREQ